MPRQVRRVSNPEWAKKARAYWAASRRRMTENSKWLYKQQRLRCIEAYGGKCRCCGEAENRFLTLDHVNGGGNKDRRAIRSTLWSWLIRNNYPSGFQVLCYNCNCGRALNGGVCPHKDKGRKYAATA